MNSHLHNEIRSYNLTTVHLFIKRIFSYCQRNHTKTDSRILLIYLMVSVSVFFFSTHLSQWVTALHAAASVMANTLAVTTRVRQYGLPASPSCGIKLSSNNSGANYIFPAESSDLNTTFLGTDLQLSKWLPWGTMKEVSVGARVRMSDGRRGGRE